MAHTTLSRIDSRFPVTMEEWQNEIQQCVDNTKLPHSYWCYVPSGTYTIGGWNTQQESATLELSAFWIARYPITVTQYMLFSHHGYTTEAQSYWSPQGWQWKKREKRRSQPWKWDDIEFNSPDQPVIGVSWYEAYAFANWMCKQRCNVLPDGYTIRMPTEAEWEVAAAYDGQGQRHSYPWGETPPTIELAVYQASERNATMPVGSCPSGSATYGAQDMLGNVWEWTCSRYTEYPRQSHAPCNDFTVDEKNAAVRGGAWTNSMNFIHNSVRDWHRPDYYDHNTGFRLVVAKK